MRTLNTIVDHHHWQTRNILTLFARDPVESAPSTLPILCHNILILGHNMGTMPMFGNRVGANIRKSPVRYYNNKSSTKKSATDSHCIIAHWLSPFNAIICDTQDGTRRHQHSS